MRFNTQPILENEIAILYPLAENDFAVLYSIASDPEIWKQHPNKDRWKQDVFQTFFEGAIKSGGAFKIMEKQSGITIGSTRFYDYDLSESSIFIGYTFYAVTFWGTGMNHAVKNTMLAYAFQFVSKVNFHIGAENIRSQIAISRLGAQKIAEQEVAYIGEKPKLNFVYQIDKTQWEQKLNCK
ncbi:MULTISPECIES: GNAT family N-acetyltransferase [Chitinophagaceae]